MSDDKALTLRLPPHLAEELVMVAAVDEMSQSDAIRSAVSAHIKARRADPAFRARTAAMARRLNELVGGGS